MYETEIALTGELNCRNTRLSRGNGRAECTAGPYSAFAKITINSGAVPECACGYAAAAPYHS
jgi:hypothetical protein